MVIFVEVSVMFLAANITGNMHDWEKMNAISLSTANW